MTAPAATPTAAGSPVSNNQNPPSSPTPEEAVQASEQLLKEAATKMFGTEFPEEKDSKDDKSNDGGQKSGEPTPAPSPKPESKDKGDEKSDDGNPPKDQRDEVINELREQNKKLLEIASKSEPESKPKDPDAPKSINEYTDEQIEGTIHFFSQGEGKETERASIIVAKAQAELSRRATARENDRKDAETKAQQETLKWADKLVKEYPEIMIEKEGKKVVNTEDPLVQAAAHIWSTSPLKEMPHGRYVAMEIAWARANRKAGKPNSGTAPGTKSDGNDGSGESRKPSVNDTPPPMQCVANQLFPLLLLLILNRRSKAKSKRHWKCTIKPETRST
jgi:hypothetical protein